MRLHVVYFLNVIDEHLAKIAGKDYSFKDASLKRIVEDLKAEPKTMGAQRSLLLSRASKKGDDFAKSFLNGENWQNDYRAFGFIQDARNALAHGDKLTAAQIQAANESAPGYDFDEDGYFTLSADMEAAFLLIKPRRVENDVELLPMFRTLEDAFYAAVRERGLIFQSVAKYVIARYTCDRKNDLPRALCRAMWKVNNIRNRYAHTGRITTQERGYIERVAAQLGVAR